MWLASSDLHGLFIEQVVLCIDIKSAGIKGLTVVSFGMCSVIILCVRVKYCESSLEFQQVMGPGDSAEQRSLRESWN